MTTSSGPLNETLSYWVSPVQAADLAQRQIRGPKIFLHSQGTHPCSSRYSILACDPKVVFESHASRISIAYPATGKQTTLYGNPWRAMESLWDRFEQMDDSPWPSGAIMGFWGYDLNHFSVPRTCRRSWRDLATPDCWWGLFSSLVIFDQQEKTVHIVASGIDATGERRKSHALNELCQWKSFLESVAGVELETLQNSPDFRGSFQNELPPRTQSNLSRSAWIQRIQKARDYIRAGDIYQINLSHRIHTETQCDPWEFAKKLFQVSPAPYSGYLDTGELQLASSSPELFLETDGQRIRSTPIKGTRPRGRTEEEDARLEKELVESEKERAELVMITDLIRNDLGRISEYGSIQTPDLLRLEKYTQVQHLVSTIEGKLRPEIHPLKALESCFPGGSITGAPKIRAMEIIEELEPIGRGPYTGAMGYLGLNGKSSWNILIRTALFSQGKLYFNVGAGIVYDSDPEMEYQETLEKAAGFMKALSSLSANKPEGNILTEAAKIRGPISRSRVRLP